jgi:hypothetical protein
MRNAVALVAASMFLLFAGTGCTMTAAPINGSLFVSGLKSPVAVGDNSAGFSKTGRATATGVLGIVVDGDCSIEAAMADGGINRIHHVDSEITNILGVYGVYTTVVHGD